jgi:hypothetical protein
MQTEGCRGTEGHVVSTLMWLGLIVDQACKYRPAIFLDTNADIDANVSHILSEDIPQVAPSSAMSVKGKQSHLGAWVDPVRQLQQYGGRIIVGGVRRNMDLLKRHALDTRPSIRFGYRSSPYCYAELPARVLCFRCRFLLLLIVQLLQLPEHLACIRPLLKATVLLATCVDKQELHHFCSIDLLLRFLHR